MKGCRPPSLLAACLLAALCAGRWAPRGRGGEPAPPGTDAARLVRDLGSADFEVRQAATRRLLEYEAPPPALRAALQSGDAEVARRARRIIREIGTKIQNNSAADKGGGFYLTGASLTLEDCTLTGNTATKGPGGLKRSDSIYTPIRGTLTDSVVEEP